MKKVLFIIVALSMFLTTNQVVNSQDNITEVYVREHIPQKKPAPYPYIREADVYWDKVLWRMLDLREKQNLPLFYPQVPIDNRINLITLILKGIDNEGLTAYSTDDPKNEFKVPLTKEVIDRKMGAGVDTIKTADPNTGELMTKVIQRDRRTDEVKQILIKEKWFFDKQHSTLQVRIIGICPIRVYNRLDENGNPTEEIQREQTFWIYYPEVRKIFTTHEIFNRFNDAQRISFDDFFYQRRFSSFIYAESNVYDNRIIKDYTSGLENLYEAERIKNEISNWEHDLWEY